MHNKKSFSKDRFKNPKIPRWLAIAVIVLLFLIAIIFFFQKKVRQNFAEDEKTILKAQVSTDTISTTVSGSGTLVSEDVEDIEIPDGVELKKVYVQAGSRLEAGAPLASVKADSVRSALAETQKSLDQMDEKLAKVQDETASSKVKAPVEGRIKAVFVEEGDDVASVMSEKGALMIMSLDGKMAVDLDSTAYTVGDSVQVTDSDGNTYTGTVDKVGQSQTTVLITDKGPQYGDQVTIGESDTGSLYIHKPLKITGYAGTVKSVKVSENTWVSPSQNLINLTDTDYQAQYDSILKERQEAETLLQKLAQIYQTGVISAPFAGRIDSLHYDEDGQALDTQTATQGGSALSGQTTVLGTEAQSESSQSRILASMDPEKRMTLTISVDETDILSLKVGQEATVTVDSIQGQSFTGQVTGIDTSQPSSSGGVTTYRATISLDRQEKMLAGMTASAAITIQGVDKALVLPEDAVQKTSTSAYVYTTYDENSKTLGDMVEVKVGLSNGNQIEILEGLKEGDQVYYQESQEQGMGNFNGGMPPGGGMPGGGVPGNMPGSGPGGQGIPSGPNSNRTPGN